MFNNVQKGDEHSMLYNKAQLNGKIDTGFFKRHILTALIHWKRRPPHVTQSLVLFYMLTKNAKQNVWIHFYLINLQLWRQKFKNNSNSVGRKNLLVGRKNICTKRKKSIV